MAQDGQLHDVVSDLVNIVYDLSQGLEKFATEVERVTTHFESPKEIALAATELAALKHRLQELDVRTGSQESLAKH